MLQASLVGIPCSKSDWVGLLEVAPKRGWCRSHIVADRIGAEHLLEIKHLILFTPEPHSLHHKRHRVLSCHVLTIGPTSNMDRRSD